MQKSVKSILNRSGLLTVQRIAELFCLKKETLLEKWNAGEPIIRDLEFRRARQGRDYVATETNVYRVFERWVNSLEIIEPRWKTDEDARLSRNQNNRIYRRSERADEIQDPLSTQESGT